MAGGTKYVDLITLIQRLTPAPAVTQTQSAYASLIAARRTDNLEASINAGAWAVIGQVPAVPGLYGNGVDGDLNFDGTSTITLAGDATTIVPFLNVYKLPRDIYPRSMIIANGVTVSVGAVAVGSFRIFCFGEANIIGTLNANGGDGGNGGSNSSGSSGTAFAAGTIGAGSNGGLGNVLSSGGAGTNITYACGQIGGAGGAGTGAYVGGAAGTLNAGPIPTAAEGSANVIRSVLAAMGGFAGTSPVNLIRGGSGGGGGGGDASNGGGGGGAGGNVIFLCAKAIIGAGTIRANGGAAGNAYQTSGNAGGGGGGGGGVVFTVSDTTPVPTIQANGGALGLGRGTGTNGNAGTTGVIVSLVRS